MIEKVKEVKEKEIRSLLAMDGGSVELVNFVEAMLREAVPEVKGVFESGEGDWLGVS